MVLTYIFVNKWVLLLSLYVIPEKEEQKLMLDFDKYIQYLLWAACFEK
jgi:hypothetical protein